MWIVVLVIIVTIITCLIISTYKKSEEKKRLEQQKKEKEAQRKAELVKRRQEYWATRPQFYARVPKNNWYKIYEVLRSWQPAPYIGSPKDRVNFREKMDMHHEDVDKFEALTGCSFLNSNFRDDWRDLDMKYLASALNIK